MEKKKITDEELRDSQVKTQLIRLGIQRATLSDRVALLEKDLNIVLRKDDESFEDSGYGEEGPLVPLAAELQSEVEILQEIANQVASIINRLEV